MAITRRAVLTGAVGAATTMMGSSLLAQQKERPAPLNPATVKEFVGAGHSDLEKVKIMVEAEPQLVYASWDWGGGDFESALEGAGHMGNREIALYLISKGARMSIFQAAMLGELELVQAMLRVHPELFASKGPHGITLMRHAEKGGKEAEKVLAYLQTFKN